MKKFTLSITICFLLMCLNTLIGSAQNNTIFASGNYSGNTKNCFKQYSESVVFSNTIFASGNASGATKNCFQQYTGSVVFNNAIFASGNAAGATKNCFQQYSGSVVFNNAIFASGNASGAAKNCIEALIPLPVTILNFKATFNTSKTIVIIWNVASEINLDYYIVQHSDDMITWQNVATVKANSAFHSNAHYTIEDKNPPKKEIIYYRLIPVDMDGTLNVPIYDVLHVGLTEYIVKFNNPIDNNLSVFVTNQDKHSIKIQMYNMHGVMLKEYYDTESSFLINTSDLTPSCYIMVVYLNNEIIGHYKIVKE